METMLRHAIPCPKCEQLDRAYERNIIQAYSDATGTWRRHVIFNLCQECQEYVQHRVTRDRAAHARNGQSTSGVGGSQ